MADLKQFSTCFQETRGVLRVLLERISPPVQVEIVKLTRNVHKPLEKHLCLVAVRGLLFIFPNLTLTNKCHTRHTVIAYACQHVFVFRGEVKLQTGAVDEPD